MYTSSVAIGPEFFVKSFNDYRDKFWAFAREILQNSIDCWSKAIRIKVVEFPDDDQTLVIVMNDGAPMTREILVDKLLSLGSSGKDFQDSIGGFGKAKEIIYFAHRSYSINSGDWMLGGSGAGYNLHPRDSHLAGTTSSVTWAGLVGEALRAKFRRFIQLCDRRNLTFYLDGEEIKPEIPRFRCLRPLVNTVEGVGIEWAHLGMHPTFESGLMLVRIGGIPMFVESCGYKATIVLELQGTSGERLTANRDSLRYPYSTNLRELITQMTVDRRSALKLEKPVYTRYGGPRLRGEAEEQSIDDLAVACVTAKHAPAQDAGGGIAVEVQGRVEARTSLLPFQFINKNCVTRRVPREFDPLDLKFSDHAFWLTRAWAGCLVELHGLYEIDRPFSVGFVFSEDAEAEFEESSKYGRVYFLNPCVIGRKAIKRRYKKANRGQIAALAAHEFVHGGLNESWHDEDYANKLTDVMGMMVNHWRRFARHFT